MKYVLSPKTMLWANRIAKIPLVKNVLKPIYYPYKKFLDKKRNEQFRINGLNVLIDFDNCMREYGKEYTLAFGTMLGAVREHGFIKHDCDLDVFLWIEDYSADISKCLESYGFTLEHSFLVEKGTLGREETYVKNNVSIDIFYIYPPIGQYPYTCDFSQLNNAVTWAYSQKHYGGVLARRIEIPISKERVKMKFESAEFYVPANYDEFLSFRYGDDYMVPNPSWHNGANPHIIVWNEVHADYIEFD